ncbi:MAG: diphosphate--fructose-6-phosphate 1-phosphotransferase, partial [Clostridia bacterium]|nr:diphosphate--fructose-6-phosphate 1-phosphotransferase [Clostridia bacterium]
MAKNSKKPTCSVLQQHRCKFKPVLPEILKKGACFVKPKTGKATQSVADQATVKKIFPNTYGMPEISFVKGSNPIIGKKAIKAAVV